MHCFAYLMLVQLKISSCKSFMFSSFSQHFGQGTTLGFAIELISESFMWRAAYNQLNQAFMVFLIFELTFKCKSSRSAHKIIITFIYFLSILLEVKSVNLES